MQKHAHAIQNKIFNCLAFGTVNTINPCWCVIIVKANNCTMIVFGIGELKCPQLDIECTVNKQEKKLGQSNCRS